MAGVSSREKPCVLTGRSGSADSAFRTGSRSGRGAQRCAGSGLSFVGALGVGTGTHLYQAQKDRGAEDEHDDKQSAHRMLANSLHMSSLPIRTR